MASFGEKLRRARRAMVPKMTQEDLGTVMGWDDAQRRISNYENGIREPTPREAARLATILGVTADSLLSDSDDLVYVKSAANTAAPRHRYPMIDSIPAGTAVGPADPYPPGAGLDVFDAEDPHGSRSFGLYIKGNSMTPRFEEGDKVLFDPDVRPNPGDYVAAANARGEVTFKKYRPRGIRPDGQEVFELAPLNDDFPTVRSDQDGGWRIIGTYVELRAFNPRARRAADRVRSDRLTATYSRPTLFDDGWPQLEE